jgi:hypothetical protein
MIFLTLWAVSHKVNDPKLLLSFLNMLKHGMYWLEISFQQIHLLMSEKQKFHTLFSQLTPPLEGQTAGGPCVPQWWWLARKDMPHLLPKRQLFTPKSSCWNILLPLAIKKIIHKPEIQPDLGDCQFPFASLQIKLLWSLLLEFLPLISI